MTVYQSLMRSYLRPRTVTLALLWGLPTVIYVGIACYLLWRSGWTLYILATLAVSYVLSIAVARMWPKTSPADVAATLPIKPAAYWTQQDRDALAKVQEFRDNIRPIGWDNLYDSQRYVEDTQTLARKLSEHYHSGGRGHALRPLTLIEITTAAHLAVEDVEQFVIDSIPGSSLLNLDTIQSLPKLASQIDKAYRGYYLLSSVLNPVRLLTYPLWSKSGEVGFSLQEEAMLRVYQKYLQVLGFYLVEMYSGRLRGGSRIYKQHFRHLAAAAHTANGDMSWLDRMTTVDTKIAVMGQVKAGKSSLINALTASADAEVSPLPQTRALHEHKLQLAGSEHSLILLDTPGYEEAGATVDQLEAIDAATETADIVLLVLAANSPAKSADVELLKSLHRYYDRKPNLKMPIVIGVLTHIDLLSPVREWSPPYNWRAPETDKARSIASAVEYSRGVFGSAVANWTAVHCEPGKCDVKAVADEIIPVLLPHLDEGRMAAVLKTFHDSLSKDRVKRVAKQIGNLLNNVGGKLLEELGKK